MKAVNDAMDHSLDEAVDIIHGQRNLTEKRIRRDMKVKKSTRLAAAFLDVSTRAINLANYIDGARKVMDFTGIPNEQRRPLRFTIKKGRTKSKPGVFLQRGRVGKTSRAGKPLAFRKPKSGRYRGKMVAQNTRSLHSLLSTKSSRKRLERTIGRNFRRAVDRQLKEALGRIGLGTAA